MNGVDTEEHFGACRSRQRLTDGKNLLVLVTYQRMALLIEICNLTIGSSTHPRSVTNLSWNCAAVSFYSVLIVDRFFSRSEIAQRDRQTL